MLVQEVAEEQILKRECFSLKPLLFHPVSTLLNISFCSYCCQCLTVKWGVPLPLCAPSPAQTWVQLGCGGACVQWLLTSSLPPHRHQQMVSPCPWAAACSLAVQHGTAAYEARGIFFKTGWLQMLRWVEGCHVTSGGVVLLLMDPFWLSYSLCKNINVCNAMENSPLQHLPGLNGICCMGKEEETPRRWRNSMGIQMLPQLNWQRSHWMHLVCWWGGEGCEGERTIWFWCLDFLDVLLFAVVYVSFA